MAIQTGTSIGQSEIDLLEKNFAVTFPDDYKTFLKQYNGFRVASPDNCDIPFDKVDNGYISFDALFGHQVNNENYELTMMNDEFLDELSFIENAVIIGIDPGDNFYVLITEGEQAGVYYWDRSCLHADDLKRDYVITGEEDSQHLYLCDTIFSKFLESLLSLTIKKGMSSSSEL
ncbi:SMI1/KNR4 family protein [Enterobacter sp. Bisph1]|uniref:SMI1/KNR4 family protein n=1 Tax=Enterobacter sp. Bisph1 TaxID=1274399 RepID=UPI00057C0B82|nr:SMI1/KNR4 family protein [Enterobacter sp. Bisph1]